MPFKTQAYGPAPSALLIADSLAEARAAAETLATAGVRIAAELRFAEAPRQLALQAHIDLVVVEAAGVADEPLEAVLAQADQVASAQGATIVATLDAAQLDLAVLTRLRTPVQLLCAPSAAERLGAITLAKVKPGYRLHDGNREAEQARLQRLSEEVARIAETLARLTREDRPARRPHLREHGVGYHAPATEAVQVSPREIRATIRARRLRSQFFAPELLADPAWDMLLDLFASDLEHRRVSVSSLCIAAAVPPTTALRWIGALHDAGIFERHADPTDRRRAYIALSGKGSDGMRNYIAAVRRAGLAIV